MKIQWTYKLVKKYVKSIGYILVSTNYINAHKKLIVKDSEGYFYVANLNNLKSGKKPNRFIKNNPYTIQNIKLWCKINKKPFKLTSNEYQKASIKMQWKCLKEGCQENFESSWNSIITNIGCPFCSGHQVGLSNCLSTKNPNIALEWHPIKNGGLTPHNVTTSYYKKVWWKCKKCEHEWESFIQDRNRTDSRQTNCPACTPSKGEQKIIIWLQNQKVKFIFL